MPADGPRADPAVPPIHPPAQRPLAAAQLLAAARKVNLARLTDADEFGLGFSTAARLVPQWYARHGNGGGVLARVFVPVLPSDQAAVDAASRAPRPDVSKKSWPASVPGGWTLKGAPPPMNESRMVHYRIGAGEDGKVSAIAVAGGESGTDYEERLAQLRHATASEGVICGEGGFFRYTCLVETTGGGYLDVGRQAPTVADLATFTRALRAGLLA